MFHQIIRRHKPEYGNMCYYSAFIIILPPHSTLYNFWYTKHAAKSYNSILPNIFEHMRMARKVNNLTAICQPSV
jgi:hypothetical protein